jgi:hypothetical protein
MRYLVGHPPLVRTPFETLRNSVRTRRELALEDVALRQQLAPLFEESGEVRQPSFQPDIFRLCMRGIV